MTRPVSVVTRRRRLSAPTQAMLAHCQAVADRYRLSPREAEVLILLAQGRSYSFIQDELNMASSTVKTHVSHIYAKFDVPGRQELLDVLWSA